MFTLSNESITKNIINLIRGEDYIEKNVEIIDSAFIDYTRQYLQKILNAKIKFAGNDMDWYKEEFLSVESDAIKIGLNSELTVSSMKEIRNSTGREVVLEKNNQHIVQFYEAVDNVKKEDGKFGIGLKIRYNGESVDLNFVESLVVMKTLAEFRSVLEEGLWSVAERSVETPLMITLCRLFGVSSENYKAQGKQTELSDREADFCLVDQSGDDINCEVKLMGGGNPEGADAGMARESTVFIADKLSAKNKNQFDSKKIHWVELRRENGFMKFGDVLDELGIPRASGDVDVSSTNLTNIISESLQELNRTG